MGWSMHGRAGHPHPRRALALRPPHCSSPFQKALFFQQLDPIPPLACFRTKWGIATGWVQIFLDLFCPAPIMGLPCVSPSHLAGPGHTVGIAFSMSRPGPFHDFDGCCMEPGATGS